MPRRVGAEERGADRQGGQTGALEGESGALSQRGSVLQLLVERAARLRSCRPPRAAKGWIVART